MAGALAQLDHLIVAAPSLEAGAAWLQALLGVSLAPGGRHLGYGTHNLLLSLGAEVYLELIAPDPDQGGLARARPFSLDTPELRARIAERPRLIHHVCRTKLLDRARAVMSPWAAPAVPMRREELAWRITIPDDGLLPGGATLGGVLPSLIDWGGTPHPCTRLPDRGARLVALELDAPAHALRTLESLLGKPDSVRVRAGEPALRARLRVGAREVLID